MTEADINQTTNQKKDTYCRPQLKKLGSVKELTHSVFNGASTIDSVGSNYTDLS